MEAAEPALAVSWSVAVSTMSLHVSTNEQVQAQRSPTGWSGTRLGAWPRGDHRHCRAPLQSPTAAQALGVDAVTVVGSTQAQWLQAQWLRTESFVGG